MSITLPHCSIPGNAALPRRPVHIHIPRRAGPRPGEPDGLPGARQWYNAAMISVDNSLSPHGGVLVERVRPVRNAGELAGLPVLPVRQQIAHECVNIAYGFFAPLAGFMGRADTAAVAAYWVRGVWHGMVIAPEGLRDGIACQEKDAGSESLAGPLVSPPPGPAAHDRPLRSPAGGGD